MIRIFLENKEIDVIQEVAMDLNYSIADIMELDKRNTQFSKTILLPNSPTNAQVFGYIYDLDVQNPYSAGLPNIGLNFNPTKKAKAVIFKDNIVVFRGICRLIQVKILDGRINYEVNLFGILKDILYKLGEKYLYELNWTDNDYVYDRATTKQIYRDKKFSGDGNVIIGGQAKEFCLPMVDYGNVVDMTKWDWKDFKPNIFVRNAMIKMFQFAGFVSNPPDFCPFFDTSYFRKLAITNGERMVGQYLKDIYKSEVSAFFAGGYDSSMYLSCNASNWFEAFAFPSINNGGLFIRETIPINYYQNPFPNAYRLRYVGAEPIKVTIRVNAIMKVRYQNVQPLYNCNISANWRVRLVVDNGTDYDAFFPNIPNPQSAYVTLLKEVVETFTDQPSNNQPLFEERQVLFAYEGEVELQTGQCIILQAQGNACLCAVIGGTPFTPNGTFTHTWADPSIPGNVSTFEIGFPTIQLSPLPEGQVAKMADQIPRGIKCVDLLKTIILMHNLYVEQDPIQENLLHITPYPLYYDYDITKAVDWSDKLSYDDEISIVPLSELKAQRYKFTYEEDNDYWSESYAKRFNKEYGEKQEYITNDFLDTEEEIKSIFSPSVIAKTDSSNRVYLSLYKLDGTIKKVDRFKPRIGLFNGDLISDDIYFWKDNTTILYASNTDFNNKYGYIGHFDNPYNPTIDCNWTLPDEIYFPSTNVTGNNLYETFWKSLIADISDKDSRLLVGYFDLKSFDVDQIDFARMIRVNNQYYKLMKIERFNPNGDTLAKVSLFKVLYNLNVGDLDFLLQEDNPFLLQENGTNRFYI
jgi:hypothetical protein